MPKQKDLKRLVRARMRKTGESYTTARAMHIARRANQTGAPKAERPPVKPAAGPAPAVPADLAKVAGMSDAAVAKATGCDWSRWVRTLDRHGAASMSHRDIAQVVHEFYKMPPWWSQMVTVGYERIRGLREKGQLRSGTYTVSKSRTFAVPVENLFAAFAPARLPRWLDGARPAMRKSTAPRSVRMKWEDGTNVAINFWKKGVAKSQAQLQHDGLPSRAEAERMRSWWTQRLAALGKELAQE
jgi:hypothetical protein